MHLNVMPNTRKCEGIIQNTETLWAVNKNYKTGQDGIMSVNIQWYLNGDNRLQVNSFVNSSPSISAQRTDLCYIEVNRAVLSSCFFF